MIYTNLGLRREILDDETVAAAVTYEVAEK